MTTQKVKDLIEKAIEMGFKKIEDNHDWKHDKNVLLNKRELDFVTAVLMYLNFDEYERKQFENNKEMTNKILYFGKGE